jgi:biotin transport system permease protein/energy-coupling factor transport system permease protein
LIGGLSSGLAFARIDFRLSRDSIFMLVKLFCLLQAASILYRTSTSLEIREGCEKIEIIICKILHLPCKKTVSNAISLFINFIPMVFSVWNQSKKAWYARHGKKGIKMYLTLLPVLFSVGMKKAYNTAKAIQVRE